MKLMRIVSVLSVSLGLVFALACTGRSAEKQFEEINPADFDATSADITNEWYPMKPGEKHVFDGQVTEDGETIPHRVEWVVTDLVKDIHGIDVAVILESDISDGKMIEMELTFFAQDKHGNVWHLGQHRETYSDLEFVGGRAWMVGYLEGARAGIMMPAAPRTGTPSYSEGYAPPPFNWTDRGRVSKTGEKTTVRTGSYDNVVVIEEWDAEEPDGRQLKYYARGVGLVRVGWTGDDAQKEELELVEATQLTPEQLAEARATAKGIEMRAYIYGATEPAHARK